MRRDPKELATEWKQNPKKTVLVIDEIREHQEGAEYVTFCCIRIDGVSALDLLGFAKAARQNMKGQAEEKTFKGAGLFGSRQKRLHDPMRHYVFEALTRTQGVSLCVTSSERIKDLKNTVKAGITLQAAKGDGQAGRVEAPELPILMDFLKKAANDWGLGATQVDVIIDRAAQLGSDPAQRKIDEDTFEVWGPGTLNKLSDGTDAINICPTSFRFIMASDDGLTFRDLLLLPDALGYLGQQGDAFADAKARVKNGEDGWVYFADLPGLQAVAKKVIENSRAAEKPKK